MKQANTITPYNSAAELERIERERLVAVGGDKEKAIELAQPLYLAAASVKEKDGKIDPTSIREYLDSIRNEETRRLLSQLAIALDQYVIRARLESNGVDLDK